MCYSCAYAFAVELGEAFGEELLVGKEPAWCWGFGSDFEGLCNEGLRLALVWVWVGYHNPEVVLAGVQICFIQHEVRDAIAQFAREVQ